MASGLSKRVAAIETAIALLGYFSDRLRYLRPTMSALVGAAGDTAGLREAAYLAGCGERMARGEPFPEAWRAALEEQPGALGEGERELLRNLADILGAADLDSQLAALAYAERQMEHRLGLARANREKHQKLYGTLGVLGGLAVAIMLA